MIDLAAIRRATGLTEVELAANLGAGQAQISKVERQGDMLVNTLASYLDALGADAPRSLSRWASRPSRTT